ncbi:12703_t:CDS:2 [Entrophospora sp. SA101]|nr:12703_t:CDS:2 [Entrophospora sp. SA101]
MSTDLYAKIYNFLVSAQLEHITAVSVIYQGIEEEPWILQNELRSIVDRAVTSASNFYDEGSPYLLKFFRILTQFEIAFEGVCSLRDIGKVKTYERFSLSPDEIRKNINELKAKLKKNTSPLYRSLYTGINNMSISGLTWEDPLASQVISDNSELVHQLPEQSKYAFMKPARLMIPPTLPLTVQNKCSDYVANFIENRIIVPQRKLSHDGTWKESDSELANVAERILDTLNDSWNNPAFGPEFVDSLNEGTYVTNVVVPAIRATLKDLPLGKSTFVSSSERQSDASADRRGDGRSGKRPDIMFVMKHSRKNYELLYAECSRLSCTTQKEKDDQVKLWREVNDGMFWVRKSRKPDKDEFGIIGVQVAGRKIRLSVLIRDMSEIHRYYNLHESEIPVQQSDPSIVSKFVETLLILRNILIVNMTLLHNVPLSRSIRHLEDSSTISSPPSSPSSHRSSSLKKRKPNK